MLVRRYRQDLERPGFRHDTAQEIAVRHLQRVLDQLLEARRNGDNGAPVKKIGLFSRLTSRKTEEAPAPAIKGLYLWGGVGRGKTYLVDLFFEAVPFPEKKRLHFHRFMQMVHARLAELKQQQDPLKLVAEQLAREARVICLDEFFVADITDAMLLHGLLDGLFRNGVVLVTTTNIPPDGLYKDGLQRARFLPAIKLLKIYLDVLNVDNGIDYRLRYLEKAEIYHSPLDARAEQILADTFRSLAPDAGTEGAELEIEGRSIQTRRLAEGVVWFDFVAICDGPRSQIDYIEIARDFHTVLISNIPVLTTMMENQARRFLNLVDEFYDRNVKLVVSAAAPCTSLYQGEKLSFEYQRTVSRLQEMQSKEFLARPHLP